MHNLIIQLYYFAKMNQLFSIFCYIAVHVKTCPPNLSSHYCFSFSRLSLKFKHRCKNRNLVAHDNRADNRNLVERWRV